MTVRTGDMGNTFRVLAGGVDAVEKVFGDGGTVTVRGSPARRRGHERGVPGFGISRKTGYKLFNRYKDEGLDALTDRSRRPVRYANQLPDAVERLIVACKKEKPYWGGVPARSGSC